MRLVQYAGYNLAHPFWAHEIIARVNCDIVSTISNLKVKKFVYSSSETLLRATERHVPYGITQRYLSPGASKAIWKWGAHGERRSVSL